MRQLQARYGEASHEHCDDDVVDDDDDGVGDDDGKVVPSFAKVLWSITVQLRMTEVQA